MDIRSGISTSRKYLPHAVLLIILFLTFFARHYWNRFNTEKDRQAFDETVYDIRTVLTDKLYGIDTAAKGLAGLFIASEEVTGEEFHTYCQHWGVPEQYPGMHFFAFARIADPSGETGRIDRVKTAEIQREGVHAPIVFIEPLNAFTSSRLGWDIFGDTGWRAVADGARATGRTTMSSLLKLPAPSVPDGAPGILLCYPTYADGMNLQSPEAGRKSLQGYILTGVLLGELIEQSIPESKKEDVVLTIYDVTDAQSPNPLYTGPALPVNHRPVYAGRQNLDFYGRQWVVDCKSTPAFEADTDRYTSTGILIAGGMIGLLTFLYVRVQESTRKRALQMAEEMTVALKESERKFRLLAENTLDLIWQMDESFRFIYVNPASERIFGFTPDEMVGANISDYCGAGEIDRIREAFTGGIAQKNSWPSIMFETVFRHKDGHDIPVEVHSKALVDGQGRLLGFQGTTRDISDRKREESERMELEAQFIQAQKMESVGRLAGGVAHDFNNMLSIILGYTEMTLVETDPSQPIYQVLQEIHTAAKRSSNLTQQLLAFARKQTVAPRVLDLNDTVGNMLTMLERLIGENIRLRWNPGHDLWPVKVDPAQIDQVLANLCVNARDAISGVGNVTIGTRNVALDAGMCKDRSDVCVPGEYVVLEVRDDGYGMDPTVLDQLFEPFFTTKAIGKGTGLGLATVYGIVKQNSGFIDVSSSPGKGAAITVYLPRCQKNIGSMPQEETITPLTRASETVLLVEDEPSILEMTQRMLEKQAFRVLAAQGPGEAIRLARNHSGEIHLLITDVVMPEMNGQVLARELLSIRPGIRCLFMSGYPADTIAHHGVVEAGTHFIQKPFSIAQLSAKIRDVLHGA